MPAGLPWLPVLHSRRLTGCQALCCLCIAAVAFCQVLFNHTLLHGPGCLSTRLPACLPAGTDCGRANCSSLALAPAASHSKTASRCAFLTLPAFPRLLQCCKHSLPALCVMPACPSPYASLPQVGADLTFAGPANQRRGRADSISKIVFQYLTRTQPITLEQLQEAAASSAAAAAAPGDKMGSGDSSGLLGPGSMSLQSEAAAGGGSMAVDVDAPGSDGIEVDS